MTGHGFFLIRRGRPVSAPFEADDLVDVYPLAAALDLPSTGLPIIPEAGGFDPHEAAHAFGPRLRQGRDKLREVGRLNCTCGDGRDPRWVAVGYVNTDGRTWALIRPEKVPNIFRAGRYNTPSAWPLHCEPNGGPHIELASCRRCGLRWAVVLTAARMSLVDIGRPLYQRRVTD